MDKQGKFLLVFDGHDLSRDLITHALSFSPEFDITNIHVVRDSYRVIALARTYNKVVFPIS